MKKKWFRETVFVESKKYSTRADFKKGCSTAYQIARLNGWLPDMTWLEPYKRPSLSESEVIAESKKYGSRKEFQDNARRYYEVARKSGLLSKMTWLVKQVRRDYWTRDMVFEESHKYTNRTDFCRNSKQAYRLALDNGWLDDMTWLVLKKHPNGTITKEYVFEKASGYKYKSEFRNDYPELYSTAYTNGWLAEMTWLHNKNRSWNGDKDVIIAESKKYKNRSDFQRNSYTAYYTALNNGWLDEMTWFDGHNESEHCYCVYAYIDNDHIYIGITNRPRQRHYEHSSERYNASKPHKSGVYSYFSNLGKQVPDPVYIEHDIDVSTAKIKEHEYITYYKTKGYIIINKAKTGLTSSSTGSYITKWTEAAVITESKKYRSVTDFRRMAKGAYNSAYVHGWLNKLEFRNGNTDKSL